jgi:signal transduction histidine kinase
MRLGLQILAPQMGLLVVLVGALAGLQALLRAEERGLRETVERLDTGAALVFRIADAQAALVLNVLSYRLDRQPRRLEAVARAEEARLAAIEQVVPVLAEPRGGEIVRAFAASLAGERRARAEFLAAMDAADEARLRTAFERWSLQCENVQAHLAEIAAFHARWSAAAANAIARHRLDAARLASWALLAAAAFALGALLWILRRALRPLARLEEGIARIAQGQLDARLDPALAARADEVGRLARAFNDMAGRLGAARSEAQAARAELERRVAGRTAALRKAVDDLRRSNRELEQFAYITSHDLQEPLRMIASYLQLLERRHAERLDGEAREFIGYAVEGAKRLQTLISAVLEYSRVGTHGAVPAPTDSGAALASALANLEARIRESGARVTHGPMPVVRADSAQLVQLFQNLVGNALKFRGAAPPEVHVAAERTPQGWEFAVRDNGIGIAPEYHERIFRMFQRLHGRRAYEGAGIGLAICQRIVERHGGRIWVESAEGAGATFKFTLPEAESPDHDRDR